MNKTGKTVALKNSSELPQKTRNITAKPDIKPRIRQLFIGGVVLGVVFLIIFNWYASYRQPDYLKELLRDPRSVGSLAAVLSRNTNPHLDIYLKEELAKLGQKALSGQVEKFRQDQVNKLRELKILLELYPEYPDGFAYLSVLAYNLGDCELANSSIERALELDPIRPIFLELSHVIKECTD